MKKGLLLINLGTPAAPDEKSVRRFLQAFLADKYVIDLPAIPRYLLLYGIILPFRTKSTTKAYKAIWTEQGSPLQYHSDELAQKLQMHLGSTYQVELGMRYSKPSIADALAKLESCETITVLPLYPQYALATTGSSLEVVEQSTTHQNLTAVQDFYNHPAFITAQAKQIKPYLKSHEHLLLSYHGLPERQLQKIGCQPVCQKACVSSNLKICYRAQSLETSKRLMLELSLSEAECTTSFQSRVGKTPWIQPYTDEVLPTLAKQGIKTLAISCPSFVADCLETVEEIGIRAKEQWNALGGEKLTLIPALNAEDHWVEAICELIIPH